VTRFKLLPLAFLLVVCANRAQDKPAPVQPSGATAGKQTYMHYCASCHGVDARGLGPAAPALKTTPPDLTTLAKRHNGKFPDEYVAGIVRFGQPLEAHGSSDMPVWGPVFAVSEHGNEVAVRKLIKNLCDYLSTLQEKES
jgi:mono/diheme cytochrome c family protein